MSEMISLPDGFALPVTGKAADHPDLPWTSGPRPFQHRHALEVIDGAEPELANRRALAALMNGASSLLFWIHRAQDVPLLLKDIRLDIAPVHLVYGGALEDLAAELRALPASQHPQAIHGSINLDPAEHRFRTKESWRGSLEADLAQVKAAVELPKGLRILCGNGGEMAPRITGTQSISQLAYGLGSILAQLDYLGWMHADRAWLHLSATDDYLQTIAIVQAARSLWERACQAHLKRSAPLWISGSPKLAEQTEDAAALISMGMQQQALWLGGCDELWISPINDSSQAHDWARQQVLVLTYENGLQGLDQPLAGSYTLDSYTASLEAEVEKLWAEWAAQGGFWVKIKSLTGA
ncbi:MAG: methylmalonyl-CoA mutase family protein [Schleiferiaceae bacterium]|nr:methylmalonyl-CoA mutase family protein [Schleiferiaceae bacterium]